MQKRKRIASVVTVMVLTTMGAFASVATATPATASNTSCTLTTASPPTVGVTSTPPEVNCEVCDRHPATETAFRPAERVAPR